eukprot:CAMPEP_0119046350 /NCGR_PEP_ID=MMETSP1177-20130426/46018_1 /TAXON_ID=2985 /ORGANISM="Ochromonas sp, Strain CCMP1899" /LENGTH=736 /DNA_ID=CAMNT_0007019377 /DNA_START=1046 /DNA_END=3253 /DNA_ORIENTATION=+
MSIVSVTWGIIWLQGWANMFIVYYSLFPFMVAYESERALMELFVRSNDILSEISKREKAEVELAHNENLKYSREAVLKTLPLHAAIINKADASLILALIKQNIQDAKKRDYDGMTAFSLVLLNPFIDHRIVIELLIDSLPIDPLNGSNVDPLTHDYAWTRTVQSEKYAYAVRWILSQYPESSAQLAISEDAEGRQAVNIASPTCKKLLLDSIYFFRLYEITTLDNPHYQTATSLVHLAIDHSSLKKEKVAMKFMKHRNHFLREITVRTAGNFDEEYVLGALRVHDPDEDTSFYDEAVAKGFGAFPYCLVMHMGERNLADMMVKEHVAGRDWGSIRVIAQQIAEAVGHMHENGFVHGDLKPMNIMRVGHRMKLIDLDASMSYKTGTQLSAMKYSSGYISPELVHISNQVAFVKSKSNRAIMSGTADGDFLMVHASPSQDLWALGVVLYNLATNATLFLCDGDGNIQSMSDLYLLHEWSVELKMEKLSRVVNPQARNLISLLLNKDPTKRGSIASIVSHSFFTGKHLSITLTVDRFDMFLSYRYNSDFIHAEMLYSLLVNKGVKVWWDKRSLKPGEPWEEGFCKGLLKSNVFCLVLSKGAVSNFSNLCAESPIDNVLLEIILALELYERGVVEKIFPLFIGEKDPDTGLYLKYTFHGEDACHPPSFPNCIVNSIDERLKIRLDDLGLGLPYFKAMSVAEVMTNLMRFQGTFAEGNLETSLGNVLGDIVSMSHGSQSLW